MATAVPPPLASSVGKTNGNKLSRLLIDGGTTVLRSVFDRYHPPAHLAADLSSNYSILNNLLHRRILNRHQWEKLFPPGGAVPDSNTFDITLLFLLLTTICGLSPPLSGWHAKPPPGDNSLEANLARVKFFRNELYGHVTSTGVDTATFSSMWPEISTTLHSLGLHQAEINKLKAERGGEEDHLNVLFEWADSEQEVKLQLNKRQEEHREIQQALLQIKDKVEFVEQRRNEDKGNEVLKKLAFVNIENVIHSHAEKYQQGTRKSIFETVGLWLNDQDSESRVMVITGDAGMGKSVIAAVVCQRIQQAGRLAGSHFCQHSKTRFRNPKVMLQSLACQLCELLPQYRKEIVQVLSRNLGEGINNLELGELFELLFQEPLRSVDDPGKILLMVIDGLDESEYKGRNELLDVITNHFCKLPVWLRFLVTTRREINIADHLRKFNPLQLEQTDEENVKDIRLFLETQLGNVIQSGSEEIIINELVRKAAGHILYAYLLVDFIKKNVSILTLEEVGRTLPSGVSSVYQSYFERLEKELQIGEEQFLTFVSALAAAREPLPLDFVSTMLLSDTNSLAGRRKVREAVRSISTLLPVEDGCIHFFHKSVKDWLTGRTAYGEHNFSVDEKQGHLILSQLCTDELNCVKQKGVHSSESSDTAKYALQHGVHHMLGSEESTVAFRNCHEIVKNYVIDLEIVYAKLCVNSTASSEDIIRVQKRDVFGALSTETQRAVSTLLFLLRKYHELLTTSPRVFFQVMVDRGGDDFADKATQLLLTRYHEIPFMTYMHTDKEAEEELMTGTQAVFQCMSKVTCFDISSEMEFMVCECKDGSIQLWSLQTGKLLWKRPVKIEKCYVADRGTFRLVSNSSVFSCYRSVVFHPTGPIRVLPGILSHAYSIDGDLQPLFPKSNCRFVVCSICGDNMITDSPDDAKCLVRWSLKDGDEISRTIRNEFILSFAWSPDGKLLAISHLSGMVCLVDVLNCFQTLAQVTTFKPCGMITFSPNAQFLTCWHMPGGSKGVGRDRERIRLKVIKLSGGSIFLHVLDSGVPFEPRKYESSSKGGFLMGDPVLNASYRAFGSWVEVEDVFEFVVNNESLVKGFLGQDYIKMFSLSTSTRTRTRTRWSFYDSPCNVAFALDGKTIYSFSIQHNLKSEVVVCSFDVSSGKLKGKKVFCTFRDYGASDYVCLVPVTTGVVLKLPDCKAHVQLWNFKLSQQVQSWPSLCEVTYIMPFSDQCVACVRRGFEVSILDTSSGDVVKTIPLCHKGYRSTYTFSCLEATVCNTKYQLLSTDRASVQLSDGKRILWRRSWNSPTSVLVWPRLYGIFSPKEEFVVTSAITSVESHHYDVLVLDASSGKTLYTLCTAEKVFDGAFVSDKEFIVFFQSILRSLCLQLFNVTTGDLLSSLDTVRHHSCLASFPPKGLIAFGLWDSERLHPFLQVKLPQDKVKREGKVSQRSPLKDRDIAVVQRPLCTLF